MSADASEDPHAPRPMVQGFPGPGPLVSHAYHDLWLTQAGTEAEKKRLGSPANLPHPWDPATCTDRHLRRELWLWLDAVAAWVNHEYCWEPSGTPFIPPCWPQHPHIIHELAVLADQRRRCNLAANSDMLENWHRYVLPGFLDRMKERLNNHCDDDHQPWPARGRHASYLAHKVFADGSRAFESDLCSHGVAACPAAPTGTTSREGQRGGPPSGSVARGWTGASSRAVST